MSLTKPDYKQTLNLPQTDFPMKGQLAVRELDFLKKWQDMNLHKRQIQQNQNGPLFCLTDGPPYANGHLHIGHALNKILKDIIVKFKNMNRYQATYIPGWDCHGLPIENSINKKLARQNVKKTPREIRQLCRAEAKTWIKQQKQEFIRFGILGDWDNPYMTLHKTYEAEEVRMLAKLIQTGTLYRDKRAVHWCPALQTALAEAEIEYHDHTSPAIYLKFYIKGGLKERVPEFPADQKIAFVVWTTTPWTIPANRAHAVHPQYDYSIYKLDKEHIIIADDLKSSFENTTSKKLKCILGPFKGQQLEGIETQHVMFPSQTSPIILSEHVTLDVGTGVVHTAPGHGAEDFALGKKYGLEIFSPVDEFGKYTDQVPEYKGIKVLDANSLLIERFKKSGDLIFYKDIQHSYPYCWRSKTPLIFRTTLQWFVAMDHPDHPIRKMALDEIKKVHWIPDWGENRISSMITHRPDWCLSRQRLWGVPIPVFYCDKCSHLYQSAEAMNKAADVIEQAKEDEGGLEAYWSTPTSEFLPKGFKCPKCGCTSFQKGKDILDVWFDSGVCWASMQKKHPGMTYPADLYLEGSDQHRGWFHTSLLTSVAIEKKAPFKGVLTHGFVMFAKGMKMSKSQGYVVNPQDVIKEKGAELLRLWAIHEDYTQDMSCHPEAFARLTETYRRIRNTMRFLLGNLNDFTTGQETQEVPYLELQELDQWILHKLNELIEDVTKAYEAYTFHKIYHLLNNFFNEMSALYLDIIKDRLYTSKADSLERRSAQTALFHLAHTLVGLMAPILSFLSEEVYGFLPHRQKQDSIFLTAFPKQNRQWVRCDLEEKYAVFLALREKVSKNIEDLRNQKQVRSSLEVKVEFSLKNQGPQNALLDFFGLVKKEDLADFFIVSKVILTDDILRKPYTGQNGNFLEALKQVETLEVIAKKADGTKCVRCWRLSCQIMSSGLCPKCHVICGED